MPPLLLIVLIAVIVVVATVAVVFFQRRRRRAAEARIAAASAPVPMLSEDDIAWRIGVLGTERPGLLAAYFEDAESEAAAAAAAEVGRPGPIEAPLRPAAPDPLFTAFAAARPPAAADDLPLELATPEEPDLPEPVAPEPIAAGAPLTLGAAMASPTPLMPLAPAAPRPPVTDLTPVTPGKPAGRAASTQPKQPISRRYRLWRDSATVLLGAIVAVLVVTTVVPAFSSGPRPSSDGLESSAAVAVVITESPTEVEASTDIEASTAPGDPSPSVAVAPSGSPAPTAGRRADPEADAQADAQAHPQAGGPVDPPADAAADAPAHAQADPSPDPPAHAQADPEADPDPEAERAHLGQRELHVGGRQRVVLELVDREDQQLPLELRRREHLQREEPGQPRLRQRPLLHRDAQGDGPWGHRHRHQEDHHPVLSWRTTCAES